MKHLISSLYLMLCAVVIAACSGDTNSPEGVVEKYAGYIVKEQYGKVFDITHFKNEMTKEQKDEYAQFLRYMCKTTFEKQGGLQSVDVTGAELSEDGTTARVQIVQHFGDGSEKEDNVKTVLIDDKWMIDSGK